MGDNKYSIGEFSERTGTPIRTLHYYDEIGLLRPEKHPSSGHRQYADKDVLTLQKIVCFKFLGYSLEQICTILNEPKYDLGLMETLQAQRVAFEEKKEQIEMALRAINRTITLLEEEREVDSTVLMSVIRNIQTEKEQREWLEKRISKDVVDSLFDRPEEEMIEIDKEYIRFMKGIREFSDKPLDDPKVQEVISSFIDMAMKLAGGKNLIPKLAELEVAGLSELDKIFPIPFTKQEEEWLEQAMEHYMKKEERLREVLGLDGEESAKKQ